MFDLQDPDSIAATLGARLRALRLARNLSQQEVADRVGASLSSVRRLEATGAGTLRLLTRVALALHAVQGLESLFVLPARSIAEVEAALQPKRRRARKPRGGSARGLRS